MNGASATLQRANGVSGALLFPPFSSLSLFSLPYLTDPIVWTIQRFQRQPLSSLDSPWLLLCGQSALCSSSSCSCPDKLASYRLIVVQCTNKQTVTLTHVSSLVLVVVVVNSNDTPQ